MNRRTVSALVFCLSVIPHVTAFAQGQAELNPDVSVVPDIRARMGDATPHDLDFAVGQVELGLQANLNPFTRGDVFFRVGDGEIELEEGFATFTALPAGLGLRVGKYRAAAGRFNSAHGHSFPFLEYPLLVTQFFGPRGLDEVGLNPSVLLDFGAFPVTLSADVLSRAPDDTATSDPPREISDLVYNGRLSAFLTLLGGTSFIELGASGGTMVVDIASDLRATWVGVDGKFKWRPNPRTGVDVAGEFLAQRRKVTGGGSDTPAGALGYFNYLFWGNWNIGGLAEYVQLASNSDLNQKGFALFAGYSIREQTTVIRMLLRNDDLPGNLGNETGVQLQLVTGLGKHRPHDF